jgi:hypothetical protein
LFPEIEPRLSSRSIVTNSNPRYLSLYFTEY